MSYIQPADGLEDEPEPIGHVQVVYLGPVAPHWEVKGLAGERAVIEAFNDRTLARLQLLPPHGPQFRRNRERGNRDASRTLLTIGWDLGYEGPPEPDRP